MLLISRRTALLSLQGICLVRSEVASAQAGSETKSKHDFIKAANEQWMKEHDIELAKAKEEEKRGQFSSLAPPQQLLPFKDWDYYYTMGSSSRWAPNPGQTYKFVKVPSGFVTDLTSVPPWLWSTGIRPEGSYAYAAIIHDYLYWMQERPREEADKIFLFAMEDSKVDQALRNHIYNAVRLAGGSAWSKNAALKAAGEKRFLRRYPTDFTTTWKEWKSKPDVFW